MQALLWTLSGLAVELGRDRRSLARSLEGLAPDEESTDAAARVTRRYRMARVVAHLYAEAEEYDDQRQRLAAAQSERVEHENAVRRGELATRADVVRFWTDCIANMRAKALGLGSKVSPRLVNIADANIIAGAIRAEVNAFLAELADYEPREPAGVVAGSAEDGGTAADPDGQRVGRPRAKTEQRKQRGAGAVAD